MKYAITFICLFIIASCTKPENSKPTPTTPVYDDTVLTAEKLIGKWEAIYGSLGEYDSAYNDITTDRWEKGFGYFKDNQGPFGHFWDSARDVSYLIFTDDGRYSHTTPDGQLGSYVLSSLIPKTGKWKFTGTQLGLSMYSDTVDVFFKYAFRNSSLNIGLVETDTARNTTRYYETIIKLEKR
ncbi:MAG: hypothetical protein J0L80_01810 [Chitinophagales bacterium]|nr:hypothetical protein [Chitinophagales bacterium]